MIRFYDTNILLYGNVKFLGKYQFCLSNITIEELEHIKTSPHKDIQIKYKARQAVKWLANNQDKYTVKFFEENKIKKSKNPFNIIDSDDKKIILTALSYFNKDQFIFYTYDFSCYLLATHAGLTAKYNIDFQSDNYLGFSKIYTNSDEELSNLYEKIFSKKFGKDLFNINQYVLIYNKDKELIDKYKYTGNGNFISIKYNILNSKMFGKIKPADPYQELAIDSFKNNQLTLIKGAAGTGKSLLSMGYLFSLLDEGEIDKIIIFCNTIATAGSAKLGFYPGTRTEKLLDSQIGNFLSSKLGDRIEVQRLINDGYLILLPMSDIRGFDTSGMRAGIYITQAQNLSVDLMKLALQRIGDDSICILDGDMQTQVDLDLYSGDNNGMKRVSEVFRGKDCYGEVTLQKIHRSQIANIANLM